MHFLHSFFYSYYFNFIKIVHKKEGDGEECMHNGTESEGQRLMNIQCEVLLNQ